jgi:hypothetical protein
MHESVPQAVPADPELLREISHELGNGFHRFFYLLSGLREGLTPEQDEIAGRIEELAEEIQGVVRSGLACLAPVSVRPRVVRVADLVESLRQGLGLRELPVAVGLELLDVGVRADPGLLSRVVGGIGAAVGTGEGVSCHLERADAATLLQLTVNLEGAVEWPVLTVRLLDHYMRAQGGRLTIEARRVALVVSVASEGDAR